MEVILQSVLRGLFTYRIWIFIVLGIGFFLYLRRFFQGLQEWKKAVFGLEKNITERKIISASTGLILMFLLLLGEFLSITIIAPQIPAQQADLPEAINLIEARSDADELEGPPTIEFEEDESTVDQLELDFECIENVIDITFPTDGSTISGTIEVLGSVNVDNFGSYKYEYSTAGKINWITVAAGNQLKLNEIIGFWYTSDLTPGTYLLQLVPLNNVGEELKPCIRTVEIAAEE